MNKYLSIITLNGNGLNAPIKRHRVAEEVRKHYCTGAAYKRLTPEQKTYTDWNWRVGKKIFQSNG